MLLTALAVAVPLTAVGMAVDSATPAGAATSAETSAVGWAVGQIGRTNQPDGTTWAGFCLPFVQDAYADGTGPTINIQSLAQPVGGWNADTDPEDVWDGTFSAGTTGGSSTTPPYGSLVFFDAKPGYNAEDYSHVEIMGSNGEMIGTPGEPGKAVFEETLAQHAAAGDYNTYVGWWLPDGTASVGAPTITTSSLPPTVVGENYGQTLSASGGSTPYSWSLASGSLPPGLSLASDGAISGVATAAGTYGFSVSVAGSNGASSSRSLSITPSFADVSESFPGHWVSGDSGQDFAYVSEDGGGGFSLAVWKQTPTGLTWKGIWWTSPGSSGVTFSNTIFIPVKLGNGYTSLYYATSTNWSQPGFSVALMYNNGSSLTYEGQVWDPTSLSLGETRFLPGDFVGNGRGGFAYVTPGSDGGFDVAVFAANKNFSLTWKGVWWSESGSTGVTFANTLFVPSNSSGPKRTNLYYATSTNWSSSGFALGLMTSTGATFDYSGTAWATTSLELSQIKFLPGYWSGGTREGLGYVTANSDGGFSFAVFTSTKSGLVWKGVWWASPGSSQVDYGNTLFIPADTNGDGYTDLDYATATNWSAPGFSLATMLNNGKSGGLTYEGQQWDDSSLMLSETEFIPSDLPT